MFENDDWDIDENYLVDFNGSNDSTSNLKNQGSEVLNVSKSNNNSSDIELNSNNNSSNNESVAMQGASTRKNTILDIFKNINDGDAENLKSNATKACDESNDVDKSSILITDAASKTNISERGKNVVLHVFQLKKASAEKNDGLVANAATVKSALKNTDSSTESDNKLKRKKNVAFSESLDNPNSTKKICISDSINKASTSFAESNSCKDSENDFRRQLMLDLMKSPVKKNVKISRIKQTVVREFPGPAGLLPDDVNDSEVIDLDSLDENKNNKNKYSDVCSQNTKNLFTTGAWQLMMDDLPADFELHDIASVKQNAIEFSRTFKKVPYLAGIIEYIDYKPNDPHITLKDLSGKIDARIHHSICKLYPNALGTGIVILLKEVGLIFTSKKYTCVIISPKNLVSIYSEEARLVKTPNLEKLMHNNSQNNIQESEISILDEDEDCKDSKTSKSKFNYPKVRIESNVNIQASTNNSSNDNVNVKKHSIESENIDDVHDFDFNEDDSWLGVHMEDFSTFKAHQFPSSTPMDVIERKVEKEDSENGKTERNSLLILKVKEKSVAKENTLPRDASNRPTNSNEPTIDNTKNATESKRSFDCSENDTDDEILSQLDVDTIAANYNR